MASFIYQALQSLASIKPSEDQGQRTAHQAQTLLEKLEASVRRVLEPIRTAVGVGMQVIFLFLERTYVRPSHHFGREKTVVGSITDRLRVISIVHVRRWVHKWTD